MNYWTILSIFHFDVVLKGNQKSPKYCFCTFKIKLPSELITSEVFSNSKLSLFVSPPPHSGSPSFILPKNVSDKLLLKIDFNVRINCFSNSSKTGISPMGQNMFLIISLYNLTLQYSSQENKHLSHPHYLPSVRYDFSCLWNIYTHKVYKHIEVKCIHILFSKKRKFVNYNLLTIYHKNTWGNRGKAQLPAFGRLCPLIPYITFQKSSKWKQLVMKSSPGVWGKWSVFFTPKEGKYVYMFKKKKKREKLLNKTEH